MIRLISDSSTLYSCQQAKDWNADITPLCVTIDNKTYREFEEIQSDQFVTLIQQGLVPSSSQPSLGELVDLFEKYPDDEILVISMADGLSGTYQTAVSARLQVENPDRIVVLNSKTLCGPHRYLFQLASHLIEQKKTMEQIVKQLNQCISSSFSFLLPQDFNFLKRGGRCTPLAATMGGLLKLQPIMCQTEDGTRLEKFGMGRNFSSAIKSIQAFLTERVGSKTNIQISISHAFAQQQAEAALASLKKAIPMAEFALYPLSCAFITQGGPQCIAIQSIEKYED